MNNFKAHPLARELQKLRESSKYAVAQGTAYGLDEYKEYFHVTRKVENELIERIKHCSISLKPQLLLVCGNVGDGKSHILSYLNKEHSEEMAKFTIHNDATEAHNPNENSNDTLNKLLEGFRDVNINDSSDKILLAINLGTLSKFLEEYKEDYSDLFEYVSNKKILDNDLVLNEKIEPQNFFHHVNFTDYHMYSLTASGPTSVLISTLLERLVDKTEKNQVYKAYSELIEDLELSKNCPIKFNYEFLFTKENRDGLVNLIIQTIVKHKEIVSVRSLLNFFYDLIIPVGLSWDDIEIYKSQISALRNADYLSSLIPNYIFEHPELSGLFDKLEKLDPCRYRYAKLDSTLISLINSDNPGSIFKKSIGNELVKGFEKKVIKGSLKNEELTKLFIRFNFFGKMKGVLNLSDPFFVEYMQTLYHFNCNQKKSIQKVYKLVSESARKWYGDPKKRGKVVLNIGRNQSKYRVFKDFKTEPVLEKKLELNTEICSKFVQEFTLQFQLKNSEEIVKIHIDFGLYETLNRILLGYRPNKKDNNNNISFISLIEKLINQDNETAPLEIDEVNIGKEADYELFKDSFGQYKFCEI